MVVAAGNDFFPTDIPNLLVYIACLIRLKKIDHWFAVQTVILTVFYATPKKTAASTASIILCEVKEIVHAFFPDFYRPVFSLILIAVNRSF